MILIYHIKIKMQLTSELQMINIMVKGLPLLVAQQQLVQVLMLQINTITTSILRKNSMLMIKMILQIVSKTLHRQVVLLLVLAQAHMLQIRMMLIIESMIQSTIKITRNNMSKMNQPIQKMVPRKRRCYCWWCCCSGRRCRCLCC